MREADKIKLTVREPFDSLETILSLLVIGCFAAIFDFFGDNMLVFEVNR